MTCFMILIKINICLCKKKNIPSTRLISFQGWRKEEHNYGVSEGTDNLGRLISLTLPPSAYRILLITISHLIILFFLLDTSPINNYYTADKH